MKTYLLPENGKFYKANLHCHTTCSDGAMTPAQIKELYLSHGYSIVAYTDHDVLLGHNELTDDTFLALNGFEAEVIVPKESGLAIRKTCHLCFIALEPDRLTMPFYHREKYLFGNAPSYRHLLKFDESQPDFERVYHPDCVNEMIRRGKENGFFVTYNHPTWSLEDFGDYTAYHGMDAMEITNFSSVSAGYPEYNERVYDDMLRGGERIYCVSADDNHNRHPETSGKWDSFGGFVMIKADRLDYKTITSALREGHFYASQGPHIHDLYIEDNRLTVTCSGAYKICLNTGKRRADAAYAKDGELLEKASFRLTPDDIYVRVTVIDPRGYEAYSQAYFLTDLPAIDPIVRNK